MFDLIDEDEFETAIRTHFGVLDEQFVADICGDLLRDICESINAAYETRFLVIESGTDKPMNVKAVLKTRGAAEEFQKTIGDDRHEIAVLLTQR